MTIIFIVIPIVLIWIIYRYLKKNTSQKISLIITSLLLLLFSYFIFINFYPTNYFYLKNYENNTGLELPFSAKLIDENGNNSIYSFGDYNISYKIEVSSKDFSLIQKELERKGFEESEIYLKTIENDLLISKSQNIGIAKILVKDYGFKNYEILFMDDNKTMICNSNKW